MKHNFDSEVKLYMLFDLLGDIERTGPLLWQIKRKRTEDIKNHILDLMFMIKILQKHFPDILDYELMNDYAIIHDLPEALTGDITKFEGIPESEIEKVTEKAIEYLIENFNDVIDFATLSPGYENRVDIESKIVHMLDKIQAAIIFIKYQLDGNVDMDHPNVPKSLRQHPFVVEKINAGWDLGDIFFEFHLKAINITDEECAKYNISRKDADLIVDVIKSFANNIYKHKQAGTLLVNKQDFPADATVYNNQL